MASVNLHLSSFNSGELSPLLSDRYEVEKIKSGCRRLRNFLIHVHGPAFRRPGMVHLGPSATPSIRSSLRSFTFSTSTGFVLEFCPGKLQVWSNGVLVPLDAPVNLPYTEQECRELQICQVNDIVYIVHANKEPKRLVRRSNTNWTLEDIPWKWPPMMDVNTTGIVIAPSWYTGFIGLTANATIFQPSHVGSTWEISHNRPQAISEVTQTVGFFSEVTGTALRLVGGWEVWTYGTWAATVYLEKFTASGLWEVIRTWKGNKDRNIVANGNQDEDAYFRLRVSAGEGVASSGAAVPRFILEATNSRVTGLVKITSYSTPYVVYGNVLKEFSSLDNSTMWAEGAFSAKRGYPRSVTMHGQRLWFGGSAAEPQKVWGSVINDIDDFRRSTLDDASVAFAPSAQESNAISWMVSQGPELIIGTAGDEWTLSGDGRPITASNVSFQRRSRYGSEYLPAQMMGEVACFVQRGGRKIRRIAPRSDNDAWAATDLLILAEHLPYPAVCGKVVQTAFMNSPNAILWCVTDQGFLLGMTYEAEQNVFGWHVHNTVGTIESIAVIYGSISDELWLSVNRFGTRRIERLDSAAMNRSFTEPESLIYLDSAKVFTSITDTDTVTGLGHLEGQVVSVLADGAEQPAKRVLGGEIKLDTPAKKVITGLPFTSEIQPMKIQLPLQDGVSEHKPFRLARVGLSLHSSLGGEIADRPSGRFEAINYRRVSTPMDGPPQLFTGLLESMIESRTGDNIEVVIRQTAPLPLNVGGITLKLDIYGGT
jgi:hypothetical protein